MMHVRYFQEDDGGKNFAFLNCALTKNEQKLKRGGRRLAKICKLNHAHASTDAKCRGNAPSYQSYLKLYNADGLLVLPPATPAVDPRDLICRDAPDQPDVVLRRRQIQAVRPPDFRVRQRAVPQQEPPRSPPLAVIRPLVQDPGDDRLRSRRGAACGAVGSAGGEGQGAGRQAPRAGQWDFRRGAADAGALDGDAAERVQFLDSHCRSPRAIGSGRGGGGDARLSH